jgi:tRNA (cytidine/uridine-2'-O-)-methyltransferase
MRLALYQPDMPPNVGTLLRLAACLGVPVDIIEPCGFPWDDRKLRRAGMDYLDQVELARHASFAAFMAARRAEAGAGRLILLTTQGEALHHRFRFMPDDTLMTGQESRGVPPAVHQAANARIRIPMRAGLRSINVALAGAMVLGEALRQLNRFPGDTP